MADIAKVWEKLRRALEERLEVADETGMSKYYVQHNGKQYGPWSVEEIHKKLECHECDWTDYLYDESKKDWVVIMEYPPLAKLYRSTNSAARPVVFEVGPTGKLKQAPTEPPEPCSNPQINPEEWFVLKDETKYGPFLHTDLVDMLQDKKLFEHDYIWNAKLEGWRRVSDVAEFTPDNIRKLRDNGLSKISKVFFRRRYARAHFGSSIVLHNNKEVFKGQTLEISAGGAGVVMSTGAFEIGQKIFLHFKAGDGVPPFNSTCEVVSRHEIKNGEFRYGLKFVSISQSVQKAIKKFTDKKAA